jgi:hypothetical protein
MGERLPKVSPGPAVHGSSKFGWSGKINKEIYGLKKEMFGEAERLTRKYMTRKYIKYTVWKRFQ